MLPSLQPKQQHGMQTPVNTPATDSSPGRRRRLSGQPKRKTVVAVACQPCQRRKHKCDGERPTCTPCLARNRTDCAYDADGDQRRTSALKSRIETLSRQVEDLKDIITGIAVDPDPQRACATARQLAADGFQNTTQVAQDLRTHRHGALVDPESSSRRQTTECDVSPTLQVGPNGAEPPLCVLPGGAPPPGASWTSAAPWSYENYNMDFNVLQAEYESIPIDPVISSSVPSATRCQDSQGFGNMIADLHTLNAAFPDQPRYEP
ncbi:Nitrogen assimilation transcription factor [Lasiodiplodia theobromae]|uniref:Nitrogen assimilation transcription factor nirA n=1 Tax=Lasiodiplodia theobromae TaxID=45133 RepID=A0A5N5DRI6_9PEZI|nr:Nitrogen assimilation transcription factor [Lasiodiplodia theobromae]KAB2580377.1 Nitrogen assimilation transcription factor nirA [Lasiodiplodia theobromae]KAF4540027.1 Nitrogen assimilation transcription factor [Lasiodiplodia theobromae]